jgi:hypothetical protein
LLKPSPFADHFETTDLAEAARYALAKQRMVVDNGNADGLGHDCSLSFGRSLPQNFLRSDLASPETVPKLEMKLRCGGRRGNPNHSNCTGHPAGSA